MKSLNPIPNPATFGDVTLVIYPYLSWSFCWSLNSSCSSQAATYLFGHAFLDIGAAWDDFDEFNDQPSPKVAGFGIGFKLFTPLGLLRVDTAWDIKPDGSYSRPQYLFSFGPDW